MKNKVVGTCPDCSKLLERVAQHVRIGGRVLFAPDGHPHRVLGCQQAPISGMPVVRLQSEAGEVYFAQPCVLKSFTFPGVA